MTTPSWPADYRATDDFAVLNQGQLKTLATAAYDELQANLNGGAGTAVAALVNGWYNLNPDGTLPAPGARVARAGVTTAYTAVNLGQLKTVAQPFYDRLIAEGICPGYPWSYSPSPADDYAAANLGQAKNLFQFAFGSSVPINEYGLPDWFVKALGSQGAVDLAQGTNPGGPRDPNSDTDGDGLSNAEEYAAGTRYTGAGSQDSDGDGILDGLDGWPMNPDLNPPRVPNTRFAVLPLGPNAIPAGAEIRALGDGCQILYRVWANGDLVSVSLWTPAGTKVAGLLGTSPFPILSPDGNKLAGYLRREDVGTQGAVWNFLTNSATPLPRVAFPNAQAVDTWYESAVCVNDVGTAAGSTD
ncbi:MAG TPA: thrombospondin type 3 repeat-containing protein, partial [Chthoniobacteraceae bacterium]|nr:thrombospondin type 3 repeat-containing protein [Chthoniobacteraceae bacterium]